MRNMGLALVLSKAIQDGEVTIAKGSYREAYNLRQRFYRYRESLATEASSISAVADQFKFVVQGNKLIVSFENILGETNDNANLSTEVKEHR